MSLEPVNPESLARPSGFAHAVVATGGRVAFLAGQTAQNDAGEVVGADIVEQFAQAVGNLLVALRAAGGEPEHLASLTIYVVDLPEYRARGREIGQIWRRLVGTWYPAMAAVEVSRLWDERCLVEIAGIAVLP